MKNKRILILLIVTVFIVSAIPWTGSALSSNYSAPVNVKAIPAGANSIRISWTLKNENFKGFRTFKIYRLNAQNGEYEYYDGTMPESQKKYTMRLSQDLKEGQSEKFKISITYKNGLEIFSKVVSVTPSFVKGRSEISKVLAAGAGAMDVRWYKYSGADGYFIYRWNATKHKYLKIGKVTNNKEREFIDGGRAYKKSYKYKVRPYRINADGNLEYGGCSSQVSGTTKTQKPCFVSIGTYRPYCQVVSWQLYKKTTKVTGVKIYRATSKNGKYQLIATVKDPSYVSQGYSKKLKEGKKYYYKLRAYEKINKKIYYSNFTKPVGRTMVKIPVLSGRITNSDGAFDKLSVKIVNKSKGSIQIGRTALFTPSYVDETVPIRAISPTAKTIKKGKSATISFKLKETVSLDRFSEFLIKVKYQGKSRYVTLDNYSGICSYSNPDGGDVEDTIVLK